MLTTSEPINIFECLIFLFSNCTVNERACIKGEFSSCR